MAKFMYSDSDIREWYKDAKDKELQVEILSQLNLVTVNDILDKLVDLRLMTDDERKKLREPDILLDRPLGKLNVTTQKTGRVATYAPYYYDKGYSDTEIAEVIGCERHAVADWRQSEGLPRNFRYARKMPDIKRLLAEGKTASVVAKITGVDRKTIKRIRDGMIE